MATKRKQRSDERHRYVIGARKIAKDARDVAGPVLADAGAQYMDVMHSDDDPGTPLGAHVAYAAYLTEEEVTRFRAASNCRYVELDTENESAGDSESTAPAEDSAGPAAADAVIPPVGELAWMGASLAQQGPFTGAGVRVAVLHGGTSQAMRDRFTWTRVAYQAYNSDPLPSDGVMRENGCWTTALAVPPGAQLIEAQVVRTTAGAVYDSDLVAALIWAADQSAEVVLYPYGRASQTPAQVVRDAFAYARARGVQVCVSTGTGPSTQIWYPASETVNYSNVHAIGWWQQSTDNPSASANTGASVSGVLPGTSITTMDKFGVEIVKSGADYSAAKATLLIAMLATGNTYTAQQAADALKASARDTGDPVALQGEGAWELDNAIAYLAAASPPQGYTQLAMTALQSIPNNVETRVRYHTIRATSTDVDVNANRDIITIQNPGLYLFTASCRWVGIANTTGDKILMLGNNIGWTGAASKRWKTDSRKGTSQPMGMTIAHAQRFKVGDQVCVWVNQGSGVPWNLEPTIGVPEADPATFTITRLSA